MPSFISETKIYHEVAAACSLLLELLHACRVLISACVGLSLFLQRLMYVSATHIPLLRRFKFHNVHLLKFAFFSLFNKYRDYFDNNSSQIVI